MKLITYVCDRCKKKYKDNDLLDNYPFRIVYGVPYGHGSYGSTGVYDQQICHKCAAELYPKFEKEVNRWRKEHLKNLNGDSHWVCKHKPDNVGYSRTAVLENPNCSTWYTRHSDIGYACEKCMKSLENCLKKALK